MSENVPTIKRNLSLVVVPFLTIASFLILYIFRTVDDNRLTSWKWAFANVDMVLFVPVLILGVILAYLLALIEYDRYRPAVLLSLSSFMISSIFWNVPEVIIDTARYFSYAKELELYGAGHFLSQWGRGIAPWTDMPLVPLLYGLVFQVFGESRIVIQIFTTMLFSGTVIMTSLIGKTLWNKDVGFYAGAMLLGIPYLYSQIPLMLVDVPTMFFLVLSIYTFILAMEKGGAWIFLSAISIFMAVFCKYSTWLMLSVLVWVLMVYLIQSTTTVSPPLEKGGRGGFEPASLSTVIIRGILVALILAVLAGMIVYFKYDVIAGQISFLQEYQKPGLKRWTEGFVSTFFYQTHPFITIAAICSVIAAVIKRDLKFLIISWLLILIIVLQIKRSRYALIIFPMLTLMASYGLSIIKTDQVKRYILASIVMTSVIVAVFAYKPLLMDMSLGNLQAAGAYLDSLELEEIEVLTVQPEDSTVNIAATVPVLDLFTQKKISYHYDKSNTPPLEDIKESPLRFTWEYTNPAYYESGSSVTESVRAIVLIANGPVKELPHEIEKRVSVLNAVQVFNRTTGLFRFNPVVAIYLPE
jgi:hypothetical protein